MSSYLWQNFLKDKKFIQYILGILKKYSTDYSQVVEIWPGKGIITKHLSKFFDKIILFEKDEKLLQYWDWFDKSKYKLYLGDFLQQDLNKILIENNFEQGIIFGNLPYYITSPIFRKIVENSKFFPSGLFMIQKEVAEKIKTDANKKNFLRWIVNYFYNVKYLKTVPPKAFNPAPKVYSSLVLFTKRAENPNIGFNQMINWLDKVSPYKRKTLGKIYKMLDRDLALLPQEYHKKRLEELDFMDLEKILISW